MTVTKARKHNLTAASWSANGGAFETGDLRDADNHPFGANVFSPAVQKERLSKETLRAPQRDPCAPAAALDPSLADEVAHAMKEWALEHGATHYTHMFQPLTGLTAEKHDSFFEPERRLRRDRQLLGQRADPGRAGRLVVPDRRHPRHLRGPRLHGLGPDQPGIPAREPERRPALHPDRVRILDRRGARRQDPAAALDGRALELGHQGAASARRRADQSRLHDGRPRAGVLPDRRAVLLRAPRPGHDRPDPVRRPAAEGPRARRPLLRLDPRARARLHARDRARAGQARRAGQDPPQRGRPGPVRGRADLRELERRLRPPAADDAGDAERRPPLRARLPAAREAVRRRQRLGQAQQLVDGDRHRDEPDGPRRHPGGERELPVLLHGGDPGGQQAPGPAARVGRQHRPGPPPRRERGAAGDHLGLPRRRARQGVRVDRLRRGRRA